MTQVARIYTDFFDVSVKIRQIRVIRVLKGKRRLQ